MYLSFEQLGRLSAPQMILLNTVEGEDASLAEVEADPLWRQLPAVQADRVTELDRLGYPGIAGLTRLYRELADIVGSRSQTLFRPSSDPLPSLTSRSRP